MRDQPEDLGVMGLQDPDRYCRRRRAGGGRRRALAFMACAAALLVLSAASTTAQTPAPATVTLHHSTLQWTTLPNHYVTAIVTHTERIRTDSRGNIVGLDGRGQGRAEADGSVSVTLNSGTGRRFLPLDTITLETTDLQGVVLNRHTLSVPELRADVSADGRTIVGRAPPGYAVQIEVDPPGAGAGPTTIATAADPDGDFSVSAPNGEPMAEGQGAWVKLSDGAGNVFQVRVTAFSLRLMVNEPIAYGYLTPADSGYVNYRTVPNDDGATSPRRISLAIDSPYGQRSGTGYWSSPLVVGTQVTLTIESEVLPTREIAGLTIPSLSISREAGNSVGGAAPPGLDLNVEVYSGNPGRVSSEESLADGGTAPEPARRLEPTMTRSVTADGSGRWHVELPEEALAAGNHILVASGAAEHMPDGVEGVAGVDVAARLQMPLFTVAIDGATLVAEVAPGSMFQASFFSPEGVRSGATGDLRADEEGVLRLDLREEIGWTTPPGELSYLNRGGVVEVEVDEAGDPSSLVIPEIVAMTDLEADVVSGTAPPGAALEVAVLTPDSEERFQVAADATGAWRLDLSGTIDIRPGVGARIWHTNRAGHRFYLDTAPVLIQAHPDTSALWVAPTSGRPIRAEARDAQGRVVGTATGFAMESQEGEDRRLALTWTDGIVLTDRFGANPPLAAGDRLTVRVGDDVASWVLPPLEGRIDPELNLLVGDTIPGVPVRLIAGEPLEPLTPVIETVADGAGRFRANFAGLADLSLLGGAYAEVRDGQHTMLRFVRSPAAVVQYDRGIVTGSMEPRVHVSARLLDGESVVATGATTAAGSGTYGLVMRDAGGRGYAMRSGQRLELSAPDAELVTHMEIDLPDFGIDLSPDGRTIGGARPEGYMHSSTGTVLQSWPVVNRYIELTEETAPEGNWLARLSRSIRPGDHFYAAVYESGESGFVRYRREPVLAVEHGGESVCGFVPPLAEVSLELLSESGQLKGAAVARAESDGVIDLEWRDPSGNLVASQAGDRVEGRVDAKPIAIEMGVFTATLSTTDGAVSAQVRPGSYPILTAPARDCMFNMSTSDASWLRQQNTTAYQDSYGLWIVPEDGLIALRAPGAAMRERGVSLHFDSVDGHRIYRTVYRPLLLEADVASGEVRGTGIPGSTVSLTVLDDDQVEVESATADVDAGGRFAVALRAGAVAAGRVISATMTSPQEGPLIVREDEAAEMEVEVLDVDPSSSRIVGSAPPGRRVRLVLRLSDGSEQRLGLTVAEDGRFGFAAEELPPRSEWDLTDVMAGRAELDQPGGHMTVASWTTQREAATYLPWTSAGR